MDRLIKKWKAGMGRAVAGLLIMTAAVCGLSACGSKGEPADKVNIRVAALKGPTTIGLVNLIAEDTAGDYEFTMYTAGSDIMAEMVAGNADIGLVPANVAAVMNTKVEGGVSVIDINTGNVLYCVTGETSVKGMSDLAGKTVYMTGQGATPEYTVRYLLEEYGVTDCEIEFKSEPTEIAALLGEQPEAVAILPQPFVTVACAGNDRVSIAFSLKDAWNAVNADSQIVTGVTVVRNTFLEEHPAAVDAFLAAHRKSAEKALNDVETTAALVVEQGIVPKEPVAQKAIPQCDILCITGAEMKSVLSGYLGILFQQEPKSLGGALPGDSFYYVK